MKNYLQDRIMLLTKELNIYRDAKNDKTKNTHSRNLARECYIQLEGRINELHSCLKVLNSQIKEQFNKSETPLTFEEWCETKEVKEIW